MSSVRKIVLSVVLCIVALATGSGVFVLLASLKKTPALREPIQKVYNVEVFDVERSDLQEIVSGFGTAHSHQKVVIAAQVAGEVISVNPRLKVGETVRAEDVLVSEFGRSQRFSGDVLLHIDSTTYVDKVNLAERRLALDRAELAQLEQEQKNNDRLLENVQDDFDAFKKEYERVQQLHVQNVASRSELLRAELELRQYEKVLIRNQNARALFPPRRQLIESRLDAHAIEKKLAEIDLRHTTVRPPFVGVLSEVMAEKGQYVRPGDALAELTDVSQVEIPIPLALTDYAKIAPKVQSGDQSFVELATNETSKPRWRGYVVRAAPEVDQSTRTVMVFVHVDNKKNAVPLLPGMFVHARIAGPVLKQTMVVPRDAVTAGKLFITKNQFAKQQPIVVKRTLQSLAIIDGSKSDLKPGDQVILTNLDILHDGARISVQSHRSLKLEIERQRTKIVSQQVMAGGRSSDHKGKVK